MREPALVAECAAAMQAAVKIPVTVKCRIGVDDQEPDVALRALVDTCVAAGVTAFAVHARKAWLEGLSPRENRDVPPLDYALVYALKRERPHLTIIINGGVNSLDEAAAHLQHVDGVMMGRAAYKSPALLAQVDEKIFGEAQREVDAAVAEYEKYIAAQLAEGVPLSAMTRHMLGLFHARPGARLFRRHLSQNANSPRANLQTLRDALEFLRALHAEAA